MGEQKILSSFAQADEIDVMNSKFFSPLTNINYELTFAVAFENPDPQHPHYRIEMKDFPDFTDKSKQVSRVVLDVFVDSVNGKKVRQSWGIVNPLLRKMLQPACENGNLTKKKCRMRLMI